MLFKKVVIFLLLFISIFIFSGCAKEEYKEDCLRFGVLRVEDALPVYTAERTGLFENEVEVIIFSNTREMDLALEAGVIDGILTDLVRSILIKGGEEDVRIVASASPNPSLKRKFAIVAAPESNIYSSSDLNNSETGISENSIALFLTEKMLFDKKVSNVSFKSVPDIKLRFESLLSNSLETALLPEPLVTYAEQEGGRVIIADTELGKNYSQTVYLFREKYLQENKGKVENFLEDVLTAGGFLNENPEKYLGLVAEKAGINEKLLSDYKIYSIEKIFLPELEIINEVNEWMIDKKITNKKYDIDELVTKEFIGAEKWTINKNQ